MVNSLSFKVRLEIAAMEFGVIVPEALKPVAWACCAATVGLGFSPGAKRQLSTITYAVPSEATDSAAGCSGLTGNYTTDRAGRKRQNAGKPKAIWLTHQNGSKIVLP